MMTVVTCKIKMIIISMMPCGKTNSPLMKEQITEHQSSIKRNETILLHDNLMTFTIRQHLGSVQVAQMRNSVDRRHK